MSSICLWRGQFTETQVFASRFGEDVSRLETLLDMTLPAEWTDYGQEAVNHVLNEVWPDGESNFRYCIRISYGDGQAMADLDQAVRAAGIDVTGGAAAALGALGLLILLLRGEKKKQQRTQILYLEEQMAILALAGWKD